MLQLATDDKVPIGHTFINSQKSLFVLLIKENSWLVSWESTSGPRAALGTPFCLSHQSLKVQRSCLSCSQLGQRAFSIQKGCPLGGCYTHHVFEFTWWKSIICFYAQILQFYPFFPQNIRMSWKASSFFFPPQSVHKPDQIPSGFPVTSLADFYGWLMLKATIMFELEGLKPRVFILHGELFICVWFTTVHG